MSEQDSEFPHPPDAPAQDTDGDEDVFAEEDE